MTFLIVSLWADDRTAIRVRQKERQSFMRKQRAAGEIKSVTQWGTGVFEDQLIVAYKVRTS